MPLKQFPYGDVTAELVSSVFTCACVRACVPRSVDVVPCSVAHHKLVFYVMYLLHVVVRSNEFFFYYRKQSLRRHPPAQNTIFYCALCPSL